MSRFYLRSDKIWHKVIKLSSLYKSLFILLFLCAYVHAHPEKKCLKKKCLKKRLKKELLKKEVLKKEVLKKEIVFVY